MVSVDDLVLSFQVDRAAHEDERSVESVFVGAVGFVDEEGVAALDDFLDRKSTRLNSSHT